MGVLADTPGTAAAWTDSAELIAPSGSPTTAVTSLDLPEPVLSCETIPGLLSTTSAKVSWPVVGSPPIVYVATVRGTPVSPATEGARQSVTVSSNVLLGILANLAGGGTADVTVTATLGTNWTSGSSTWTVRYTTLSVTCS